MQDSGKLLNVGRYTIRLSIDLPGDRVIIEWTDVGSFVVIGPNNSGSVFPDIVWPGVLSPRCSWTVEPVTASDNRKPEILTAD